VNVEFFPFSILDNFFALLMTTVVKTKGGTVSVASAFAGHQEGK